MLPRKGSVLALVRAVGPPTASSTSVGPRGADRGLAHPARRPGPELYPLLIGDEAFLARFRRMLTQNDYAFTYMVDYDGRPESLRGIGETIYAAAYQATSVRGPGCSSSAWAAASTCSPRLPSAPPEVTGVEVNGATLDILTRVYGDYFRAWVDATPA